MGQKILLADDSVTVQKIVTLTFSDEGVDVVPVNSGDQAINLLQYLRPALVMADVSLPGRNGYEICEFVKNHPELKNTPVILLVPAFEPFDEVRAARVGADQHLTKPFQSIRALIATVKDLIEGTSTAPAEVLDLPDDLAVAPVSDNVLGVGESGPLLFNTGELRGSATTGTTARLEAAAPLNNGAEKSWEPEPATLNVTVNAMQPQSVPGLDELDDVLDLDDVLSPAGVVVARPQVVAPLPTTNTITQAVKLTSVEAITTTTIPPSVIEEIASRVTAQVSLQLSAQFSQFAAQLFEGLATRLAQELVPRVASEVLARQTLSAAPPPNSTGLSETVV